MHYTYTYTARSRLHGKRLAMLSSLVKRLNARRAIPSRERSQGLKGLGNFCAPKVERSVGFHRVVFRFRHRTIIERARTYPLQAGVGQPGARRACHRSTQERWEPRSRRHGGSSVCSHARTSSPNAELRSNWCVRYRLDSVCCTLNVGMIVEAHVYLCVTCRAALVSQQVGIWTSFSAACLCTHSNLELQRIRAHTFSGAKGGRKDIVGVWWVAGSVRWLLV